MGTVNTLAFPVFCSTMDNLYRSPSLTISHRCSRRISLIRKPKLASSIRAVAIRWLGRHPLNPSFIVWMMFLYCSTVRATVRLFIGKITPKYEVFDRINTNKWVRNHGSTAVPHFLCSYSYNFTKFSIFFVSPKNHHLW